MGKMGIIDETGDFGLGFDILSEKDQKVLKEQQESEKHQKSINESKKN